MQPLIAFVNTVEQNNIMIDAIKLRSWWAQKQGLDGSLQGASPAAIFEKAGWARSVGGVNPYLTLFARGGISREAADKAVANLEIHELPAARGCTYVVPSSDFALALKVGQGFGDEADIRIAVKYLGVTEKEINKLMDRVLGASKGAPKDPRELKELVGDAVRNLGEAGKKRGVTTTLPLALGRLQSMGRIRRVPLNGRLDQQRYAYALWSPSPLEKSKMSSQEAYTELARRYFRWIGPATIKEFQWFSGLGAKVSKEAIEPLGLAPVEKGIQLMMFPDELDVFHAFRPAKQSSYSLVSGLDNLLHLRRDVAGLVDKDDQKRQVLVDRNKKALGGLADLPNHAVLNGGRLIGLWEFDTSSGSIVWNCFVDTDKRLPAVVACTEEFVREQLGDARSFSLDSPESRVPRIAALRR